MVFSSFAVAEFYEKPKLADFRKNIYSQFGEDGIIEKIFDLIGETSKICIEFGASDGLNCSNTANLWKNKNWKSILIEVQPNLYQLLLQNTDKYDCVCLNREVGFEPHNSIEFLLESINFHEVIDFLSIDIDGNDYYVFENLQKIRPRVISIEYNPTLPPHLDIYPKPYTTVGASVKALQRIGEKKGYSIIAITDSNIIFVLNEELNKFQDFELFVERLYVTKYMRYIITDDHGKYMFIGDKNFVDAWSMLQPLNPKPLGGYKEIKIP
jgi:hypothetical protein